MSAKIRWMAAFLMITALSAMAQNVQRIEFCDKKYEYGVGNDQITLFFRVIDGDRKRNQEITAEELQNYLVIKEDGNIIPLSDCKI